MKQKIINTQINVEVSNTRTVRIIFPQSVAVVTINKRTASIRGRRLFEGGVYFASLPMPLLMRCDTMYMNFVFCLELSNEAHMYLYTCKMTDCIQKSQLSVSTIVYHTFHLAPRDRLYMHIATINMKCGDHNYAQLTFCAASIQGQLLNKVRHL